MAHADEMPAEQLLPRMERLAGAALARYSFSPSARVTLINHSENITYRVEEPDSGERAILRVHRLGYHGEPQIASELAWLDALREQAGVETPRAIPARDGTLIQTLQSAELPNPRHAVLFTFLEGSEPAEDDLHGPFERLGEVSARMHRHARGWARPAGFSRHTWDYDTMLGSRPIWGRWQDGMGLDGARSALLGRLSSTLGRRLERFGRGPERFGLVHADLRLANLLVDGRHTRVIDFDDCGFSWFLYDLGAALSFIEHRPEVPELVAAWVRGYRRVEALSAEEEAELPTFILLRRLLLVAWIGSHADTELAQSQGVAFTEGTCALAEDYLGRMG